MDQQTRLIPIFLILVLCLIPAGLAIQAYSAHYGFLSLIHFGEEFAPRRLSNIEPIALPANTGFGYDGQFYAQIALAPDLQHPELERGLDDPAYRTRRIALPALAALLGLGNVENTLQIYALSNFAFWLLLGFLLLRYFPIHKLREFLLYASLLWSTGTLCSIGWALTDLPATTLGFAALLVGRKGFGSGLLFGLSSLFKETAILSFAAAPWLSDAKLGRKFLMLLIMIAPLACWIFYVTIRFSSASVPGAGQVTYPGVSFFNKLASEWQNVIQLNRFTSLEDASLRLFEFIAPISLAVQSSYLILRPRIYSAAWAFGIGFAVFLWFFSESIWDGQLGYSRILLPLTFAFNLLIYNHEQTRSYIYWYIVGNLGLSGLVLKIVHGLMLGDFP